MLPKNKMDSKTIDSLRFKAYLKAPRGGIARVELCTDGFGRLVVVKWTPEEEESLGFVRAREVPGSLLYDCFADRETGSFMQLLPTMIGSEVMETKKRKLGRIVTEYCQGHDLGELVSYASLSGEALPESFLWHIIKLVYPLCRDLLTSSTVALSSTVLLSVLASLN